MNKLDRISAILVMLQSRRTVTAHKIAEQFNVSLRTVYRDIRVLEEAGVPIESNAGIGYSLIEGYKLPPLMFTTEEAISFLMAEKLLSRQTDLDSYGLYRAGMNKIRAVLKVSEKDILEYMDQYIEVVNSHALNQPKSAHILQPLITNILNKKAINIKYHANYNQKISKRIVEPLGIFFMSDSWYLMAYCTMREDYRTFKINRIIELASLEKSFDRQHENLKALLERLFSEEEKHHIILKTHKSALRTIALDKYIHGLYEEIDQGEYMEQHYDSYSLEYFGRWYLSFADQATIIQPAALKDIVKDIYSKIDL